MSGVEVDLDDVVDRIDEQGIWAYVGQTGGGCATIFAGAWHSVPDGRYDRTMYSAVAGPGTYGCDEEPNSGHTDEFFIGADDQGDTAGVTCAILDIQSTRDVADLIIAQTRLPLGTDLTQRQARRILRRRRQAEAERARIQAQLDAQALNGIAQFMNQPGPWNGGDVCEVMAEALVATGRKLYELAEKR
ncbi:hypothetical protein OG558_24020 [Kribbella sp. NBC_01510]|uniref:hypothetical protein n=1 Tax=Kribbella sp. NBC_01510 TaxID=2903581 RepID=UPI003868F9B3